jgi:hypothetical protein
MGDFFKPWRRRIGVVTLVMACAFMGWWVRSQFYYDAVASDTRLNQLFVISERGRLMLSLILFDEPSENSQSPIEYCVEPAVQDSPFYTRVASPINWRWGTGAFQMFTVKGVGWHEYS